jgi:hypothetical protein
LQPHRSLENFVFASAAKGELKKKTFLNLTMRTISVVQPAGFWVANVHSGEIISGGWTRQFLTRPSQLSMEVLKKVHFEMTRAATSFSCWIARRSIPIVSDEKLVKQYYRLTQANGVCSDFTSRIRLAETRYAVVLELRRRGVEVPGWEM